MASDEKILLKAVARAYTVDEMIAALERLKEVGVPGDTMIQQTVESANVIRRVLKDMASDDSNKTNVQNARRYEDADEKAKRDREQEAARKAKFHIWVEYEA